MIASQEIADSPQSWILWMDGCRTWFEGLLTAVKKTPNILNSRRAGIQKKYEIDKVFEITV